MLHKGMIWVMILPLMPKYMKTIKSPIVQRFQCKTIVSKGSTAPMQTLCPTIVTHSKHLMWVRHGVKTVIPGVRQVQIKPVLYSALLVAIYEI